MRGLRAFHILQIGRLVGPSSCPLPPRTTLHKRHLSPVSQNSALDKRAAATDADDVEEKSEPVEMVTVQFRGNEIKVRKGVLLRTALLENGLSPHSARAVVANCRGAGTCGTCAVQIEGNVTPETWGPKESFRLNLPPHRPPRNESLRLACSVQLDGDVNVTKYDKFWGQGDTPLGPTPVSDSVTPLGELEFVLDSKRTKNMKAKSTSQS